MIEIIDKIEMRVLPALISFALLILFVLPFFAGIVNLGNCVGAFVSAVLLGIFTFYGPFTGFVNSIWQRPAGRVSVCIVSAAAAICVILACVISIFMIRAARDDPDGRPTTMIVLGCKVKDGTPSLMLMNRLDAAYDYLSDHEDVKVIVSGGQGSDEIMSEAQCMRDYLVNKGISSERIIMEEKSSSTRENLEFSREIIEEKNLNENITIVTDGYHQLRADMIAGKLGMKAYNISAHTSEWLIPTYWVREWFGVVHQYIMG